MDKNHINNLFESTTPTKEIADKIFDEILLKSQSAMEEEYGWKKKIGKIKGWMEMKRIIMSMKPVLRLTIFAVIILTISVTTYAVKHLASMNEVVDKFEKDWNMSNMYINEEGDSSVIVGDYKFTVLGIASGERIKMLMVNANEIIRKKEHSYLILATEKLNGDLGYGDDFTFLPLIKGINPHESNPAMVGGLSVATDMIDGIKYELIECSTFEVFADWGVYLLIQTDKNWWDLDFLIYEDETGEISLKDDYKGFKTLIELPLDKSKANPQKVEEVLLKDDLASFKKLYNYNKNTIPIFRAIYSDDYKISLAMIAYGKDIINDLVTPLDFKIREEDMEKPFLMWVIKRIDKDYLSTDERFTVIPYINGEIPNYTAEDIENIEQRYTFGNLYCGLIPLDELDGLSNKKISVVIHSETSADDNVVLIDEKTGEISLNPNYNGAKALFELQLEELITE